jgi:hypothetical protein
MSPSPAVAYLEISQGGGRQKNFSDVKTFDDPFYSFLLFPASHHTTPLHLHLLFVLPARPHKRKEKFFSDGGAIARTLAP